MASYAGKTVVVTGASQGIGRALCLELAPQRPRLVLAARDRAALDDAASACRERGAETLVVETDVTETGACRRLIERAVDTFGVLDVLVNNAGVGMVARLAEVKDLSIYERLMRVNYLGSVYPTYFALPHLQRARGQIVAISSLAGLTGVPLRTGYAATKHAQIGFFDSLRVELRSSGVSVTVVAPYFVRSEIRRRAVAGDGRPLARSPVREDDVMSAEECARQIVKAMQQRRRMLVMTLKGRVGRWVKLAAPALVDRMAERAVEAGK
ncbi:MAG: SDR family oxidoreductase [Acidobacteria bacterium]|jgi:short-subunit dehydrogenase|nr:SDR family oxidoreductase [Acidobacteriota bacterium]